MSLRYSSPRPNLDLIKHICPFNSILPKISIPKLCPIRWLTNDEIEILPMLYPGVGLSYPMFIIYRTFFNKGSYLRKLLKTITVSKSTRLHRRYDFVSKYWSSVPEFHRDASMLMLAHFSQVTILVLATLAYCLIQFMQNFRFDLHIEMTSDVQKGPEGLTADCKMELEFNCHNKK